MTKDWYGTTLSANKYEGMRDVCAKLDDILEPYGYQVAEFRRVILNFGPTITNNYSITIKPVRSWDDMTKDGHT